MRFEELISDEIFSLPLVRSKSESFDTFMKAFLVRFLAKIEALDDTSFEFDNGRGIDSIFIKEVQKKLITGLIETIEAYYNGNPAMAYGKLDRVLKNGSFNIYATLKQKEYAPSESFYRIRIDKGNYCFKPHEMFHIPYESRGKVTTQRFSIPGFPSLYLGRSLYICWEELNRPHIDTMQSIRLKSTRKIHFLDLSPPKLLSSNFTDDTYRYFMTFPLIACCSAKVKEPRDSFKPEYIVPQLLLQWVRNNDEIDGIRYRSNSIDPSLYEQEGELYNVVLPVKESRSSGYCKHLIELFELTETVSWQLYDIALGGENFTWFRSELDVIDSKIPKIELIKGREYPYSFSPLGKLEMYLDGMDTNKIDL